MINQISESDVEEHALSVLETLGYEIIRGSNEEYPTGGPSFALRDDYQSVVLTGRLRVALQRINPNIPETSIEDAIR